jgi:hypothetical protein
MAKLDISLEVVTQNVLIPASSSEKNTIPSPERVGVFEKHDILVEGCLYQPTRQIVKNQVQRDDAFENAMSHRSGCTQPVLISASSSEEKNLKSSER